MEKLTFEDLREKKSDWKKAVIVFTEDSFDKKYSLEERSYSINSNAKYFDSSMNGSSLFGSCLDETEDGVRLDLYMHSLPEDDMGKRWIPEYCYIVG